MRSAQRGERALLQLVREVLLAGGARAAPGRAFSVCRIRAEIWPLSSTRAIGSHTEDEGRHAITNVPNTLAIYTEFNAIIDLCLLIIKVVRQRDITANVIRSLQQDEERKQKLIDQLAHRLFRGFARGTFLQEGYVIDLVAENKYRSLCYERDKHATGVRERPDHGSCPVLSFCWAHMLYHLLPNST